MDPKKIKKLESQGNTCDSCVYYPLLQAGHKGGDYIPKAFLALEAEGKTPPPIDVLIILDHPRKDDIDTDPLYDGDEDKPHWLMLKIVVNKLFGETHPWGQHNAYQAPLTWAVTHAVKCKCEIPKKPGSKGDKAPKATAVQCCSHITQRLVQRLRPKAIMCFGKEGLAAIGLKGKTEKEHRGHIFEVPGPARPDGSKSYAFMTYKPERMLNPKEVSLMTIWERDFEKARMVAEGKYAPATREEMEKNYRYPKTLDEVREVCEILKKQEFVACDIETSGLSPFSKTAQFKVISFAWGKGYSTAFWIDHKEAQYKKEEVWPIVLDVFKSGVAISGHNFKFDLKYMKALGFIQLENVNYKWDTLLIEYWRDENRAMDSDEENTTTTGRGELGLKTLVWDYFPQFGGYEEAVNIKDCFEKGIEPPPADFLFYAAADTDMGYLMTLHQIQYINKRPPEEKLAFYKCFYGTLLPAALTVVDAEIFGMEPNRELIENYASRVAMEMFYLSYEIVKQGREATKIEDFSITSNKNLQAWLFGKPEDGGLGLTPPKLTAKGNASLAKDAIEALLENYGDQVPSLKNFKRFAKLQKLQSTYLFQATEHTDDDGKIHCTMLLHGARTGRIAITAPALQTLSKCLGDLPVVTKEEQERIKSLYVNKYLEEPEKHLEMIDLARYRASFLTNEQAGKEHKREDKDKIAYETVVPKSFYCAPEGYDLVGADLSQIEVVIAACKAREAKMLDAITQGLDMHCMVGSMTSSYSYDDLVYWTKGEGSELEANLLTPEQQVLRKALDAHRSASKAVVFGQLFGMGVRSLSLRLAYTPEEEAMPDVELDPENRWDMQPKDKSRLERAQKIFDAFLGTFSKIKDYIDVCHVAAVRKHQVISEFGRIRRFPIMKYIITYKGWEKQKALKKLVAACKRQAANSPIQGVASDMCLKSMIRCHKALKKIGGSAVVPVHDNIIGAAPAGNMEKSFHIFKTAMLEWPKWRYPDLILCNLKSDFEACSLQPSAWGKMKKIKF